MAKKRGANRAGVEPAASATPPRARRPSAETQAALAEASDAVVPLPVGPTAATQAAIAEATPRHRSASGEFAVVSAPPRGRSPSDAPALAAPVVPAGTIVHAATSSSSTVIVRNEAMVSARPAAPAPAVRPPSAPVAPVTTSAPAHAPDSSSLVDRFSDLDEAFFASDVSDQTLTSERERGELAAKPWWRRLLGW